MLSLKIFTFNPLGENTYILYHKNKSAWLIDPGTYWEEERRELDNFLKSNNLSIEKILLTHGHIDHVMGLQWAAERYGASAYLHEADEPLLKTFHLTGERFGMQLQPISLKTKRLNEGEELDFCGEILRVFHIPGHSPGSLVFYHEKGKFAISGDVLFEGSIGRTDLPGGSYELLIKGIREKLLTLPPDTKIFPGHGNATSIGFERDHNPFLRD
ncbi:MBL fold metallo-hydrolase [Cruoricaptor ignavus]|uniref:MBL fold metallo-hydrolase n=1 Tax=Cruoricaptor ignavus TaxID=1118202 RepID=UPI00370DD52E